MSLRKIRARLNRLTGRVPSIITPGMLSSERAIREVQKLVDEMKAAGVVVPEYQRGHEPRARGAACRAVLERSGRRAGAGQSLLQFLFDGNGRDCGRSWTRGSERQHGQNE
jgi:hypothetical protein